MVLGETITIECFLAVWPLPSMVFRWFFIFLPSLSMVFDGSGPLVERCDGFDGSLWSTAAATAANVWSGCKTFKGPQRARGLTAAASLFGAHKYFSSFQPYFQRVSRQAVQLWARQTSGKQKKWAREKKPSSLSQTRCQCASVALTGTEFDPQTAEK